MLFQCSQPFFIIVISRLNALRLPSAHTKVSYILTQKPLTTVPQPGLPEAIFSMPDSDSSTVFHTNNLIFNISALFSITQCDTTDYSTSLSRYQSFKRCQKKVPCEFSRLITLSRRFHKTSQLSFGTAQRR